MKIMSKAEIDLVKGGKAPAKKPAVKTTVDGPTKKDWRGGRG